MTPDEIRAIEHECVKLVARYANLNDAAAWTELAELYADEGRMTRPTAPDDWIEGRKNILAAFQGRPARLGRHICSNVVINVLGPDAAQGECALALFLQDQPPKIGSFNDRFVKTPDGWRFAERRGSLTF